MRSAILLLLVVALVAGGALFFFLGGDPSPAGLDGGSANPQATSLNPGEIPAIPRAGENTADGGNRAAVTQAEVPSETPNDLEPAELASLDANALVGHVVDLEGNGIEGCDIRFLADGVGVMGADGSQAADIDSAPRTETDLHGQFRFENLPPGDVHALRVQHPEIALVFVDGVIVGDFGEFEEPPIVLTYGKRLRGTVTNEFDMPIPGVQMHLDGAWLPSDPKPSHDRMSTVTDADGNYAILGIPDGVRCLTAVAPGMGQTTRIQSLIFMDKTGQAHTCNMQLKSQDTLAGRVTDLEGKGIGGIELLAVDRGAYRDVGNDRTISEPDGSFSFANLPPGKYQVSVKSPGFESVVKNDVETPMDSLNLILSARPMVRGVVLDGDGTGLTSFKLRFLHMQNGAEGAAIPSGETFPVRGASGGSFAVPAPAPPGQWRMRAEAPGFAPTDSAVFDFNGNGDVNDVLVSMTLGGSIRGRLVDAAGDPVVGGRLTSRGNRWTNDAFSQMLGDEESNPATVRDARSGKDGSFELAALRPSMYQLFIRGVNLHQLNVRDLKVVEGGELDLGDLVLHAGGSIHGLLLDSEEAPVVGGMVFLNPLNANAGLSVFRGKSGHDGRWRITNIAPGKYRLSGKPPVKGTGSLLGTWPASGGVKVVIAGGGNDQRDIILKSWTNPKPPEPKPPTGNLGGKLTGPGGNGLMGIALKVIPTDTTRAAQEGKSGREGAFAFVGLLPGDYDLLVQGQPESTVRVTVNVDTWTYHDLQSSQ